MSEVVPEELYEHTSVRARALHPLCTLQKAAGRCRRGVGR